MAAALMLGCFAGCGNQENDGTQGNDKETQEEGGEQGDESTAPDTSEHVDLVCYFLGDPPDDIQKVQDKINEILEEKINASITFQFTTWTDAGSKYSMVLSGGENCDIIYTAPYIGYYDFMDKDAFLELTDLIDQYAPELWDAVGERFFEETYIEGELYTIPNNYTEYTTYGISYREDLRKKYDLPVPDSMENLEAYMAGVKENEPDMQILNPQCAEYLVKLDRALAYDKYGLQIPYNDVHDIQNYWGSDQQIADYKKLKEWVDAGYWPVDAIGSSSQDPLVDFESGQTALLLGGNNFSKYLNSKVKMAEQNPEWEIAYVDNTKFNGVTYPAAPYHNGIAIPTNSLNPERAMMAISLLYTDEELNHLLMYGIEGEHYTIDENGYYVEAENNAAYGYEASNAWNFRNTALMLERSSQQELSDYYKEMDAVASQTVTPYVNHEEGFNCVITENTVAETTINALTQEYLTPLEYGMVEDIEGQVAAFMEKAEEVGLSDLQDEVITQWNEYLESKGY